jgi:monoamine oxidase
MSLTRRQFTAHLAAGAALPAITAGAHAQAAAVRASSPTPQTVDVLAIGAGLSGLQSALLLEELGAQVQVIEARHRIGGRVYTLTDRPGFPEVGGNGFAAGYGRVLDRAKSLQLPLLDTAPLRVKYPKMELVLGSEVLSRDAWTGAASNPLPADARARFPWEFGGAYIARNNPLQSADAWLDEAHADLDVSLHDWLAARGLDERVIRLCWSTNPYFGSSAFDVSALQSLFNDAWIKAVTQGSSAALSIDGGNFQLPAAMARKLKREIRLDQEVMAVRDEGSVVTVDCRDGTRYRAKRVICSLPFSVLRHVHIDPVLPAAQAEAVNNLPYMQNTLIFFTPKRRFWEEDGLSPTMWTDGIAGTIAAQRFGRNPDDVTAIVANPRGQAALWLDRLPPDEAIRLVRLEIERLRPAARGALTGGWIHSWGRDPFAAGDWAVFGPGQIRRFARQMSAPHGRIHFCGEHTARANRGMEGAMESAERVALEVSEAL